MTIVETDDFIEVTELSERGLRRLATSRDCLLVKTGNEYQILGAGLYGITLSDDDCWAVLSDLPQKYTLSGRYDPVA